MHAECLDHAERQAGHEAAGHAAEAAERDDDQRRHRVRLADRRRDRVGHRQQAAGQPGQAESDAEHQRMQPRRVDADQHRAHRRLHQRAHALAEQGRAQQHDQRQADDERHREEHEVVGGKLCAGKRHRRGQVVVAAQVTAPDEGGEVLREEHQPERDQQPARLEDVDRRRNARQARKAQPVHGHADQHHHDEGDRCHRQRRDAPARVRQPGQEGTQHEELAVGDVQDAHQPVLQVQAERHQRIDRAGNDTRGKKFDPGAQRHCWRC